MKTIYSEYEATIGIEIHVQLKTEQKLFCFCKNEVGKEQNKNICPICCGYPGTLPLLNKNVIQYAIMAGLATNSTINKKSSFARKHYFYADLPKGYQISQNDFPICENGHIEITSENNTAKKINIQRIHMEEDAGKNIHTEEGKSLVDLNRAGTPLLEIVSFPDMSAPCEVVSYLKTMHSIMVNLGITSGNMEEGAFRADTNISVRKKGDTKLGTKCELKNINSFKFIKDATVYEIKRQIDIINSGEKIIQQTRLWDTKKKETYSMRTKERADDYRYLEDPDLTPVIIEEAQIEEIKKNLPDSPQKKIEGFIQKYNISRESSEILTQSRYIEEYFKEAYNLYPSRLTANWIVRDLIGALRTNNIQLKDNPFPAIHLKEIIELLEADKITSKIAKDVFEKTFSSKESPLSYVKKNNLYNKGLSESEIIRIIEKVFQDNPAAIQDLKNGRDKAKGFLVGQIMKKTSGKASPKIINKILAEKIK